ncbi:MAG: transcription elongation factor GreB [Ectothiorhodospiraceae bacterium]|nr:transcription elongation factor GreB [Chromatiales bacterium]MCP5154943.1 transcription elongation factor GreB [Ectothiorhodospiraceae bacterium]
MGTSKRTGGPRGTGPSPYVTEAGYRLLGEELDGLWARRRDVVTHLAAAAAEGDRSENAEYIYRKKQLREIDRRIRYLQRRLPELKPVPSRSGTSERVYFGAWVTVEDEAGATACYRIVGSDEIDAAREWISVDSPMARALMGREIGDEVHVRTPSGDVVRFVLAVEFEDRGPVPGGDSPGRAVE